MNTTVPKIMMATAIAACLLSCNRHHETDTSKSPPQELVVPDSWEVWHEWVVATNWHVAIEVQGGKPPGGVATWTEHWTHSFTALRKNYENPNKYIAYVIETRRKEGLPELPISAQ
jgi:hypothetical protein